MLKCYNVPSGGGVNKKGSNTMFLVQNITLFICNYVWALTLYDCTYTSQNITLLYTCMRIDPL